MILMHGFGMLIVENGVHKLLVESKRARNLKNVDFSFFLKKTSFFLVKTVKKIDIFDQVQAKMTFQKVKISLPFPPFLRGKFKFSTDFTTFTRKKIFWWEKSKKKSIKIIKMENSKTPLKSDLRASTPLNRKKGVFLGPFLRFLKI